MSDEPMRTVRDGIEVHPGLDADHRPELVPDPEPEPSEAPEAVEAEAAPVKPAKASKGLLGRKKA